jgi:hypothetical protein
MERARDLLKDIFKGSLSQKGQRYYSFFKSWERILGKELSKNVRLVDIKKDVLLVSARHPGWKQMVYMKKHRLLALLNNLYPELAIKNIKISLLREDVPEIQSTAGKKQYEDNKKENTASEIDLRKEMKPVENGELRKILKRLYSSIHKRR